MTSCDLGVDAAGSRRCSRPWPWRSVPAAAVATTRLRTPVVTSRGTSTEEVAGGAAVLVDPFDVEAIADGLREASRSGPDLAERGRVRAHSCTWRSTAERTLDVYRELAR